MSRIMKNRVLTRLGWILMVFVLWIHTGVVEAQIVRNFQREYTNAGSEFRGNLLSIGNALLTCTNCDPNSSGIQNGNRPMAFIDADSDATVGTGMVGAPACGDVMKLQIKVGGDGIIEDARFKTYGCGSAIASSSLVTEWVKGKTLDEALAIKNSDIAEELALPPVKIHCSVLAEDAIRAAIDDIQKKSGQDEAA
jgi:nitrogen fixation NifU-like protein